VSIAPEQVEKEADAAIQAIVKLQSGCPDCYAERGEVFPPSHSTKTCRRHAIELQRKLQETSAQLSVQISGYLQERAQG
jgi:hypothetical protein